MAAVNVAVQLILRLSGRHSTELRAKALPGYGVGVNNDGVFRCRKPPWRRLLGGFLLGLYFSRCRRSDDDGFDVVSFFEASLWKSC
jgi:hypothetical protein